MTTSPAEIRFLCDHMLVKLGKYLRILGYDAEWDPRRRTHELIRRANDEGRVFLTRNRRLESEYPRPARPVVFREDDPVAQLNALAARFGLEKQSGLFSACIRCNCPLDPVADKEEIRDRVHPAVFERHERFFRCPSCGTVFWHGSHVRNTCRKLGLDAP